uniref:Uncharacterized protein n=1 Tax=Rhizophora mucronata TaxID=61149 RepID=A0A2P2N8V1_RHIMU
MPFLLNKQSRILDGDKRNVIAAFASGFATNTPGCAEEHTVYFEFNFGKRWNHFSCCDYQFTNLCSTTKFLRIGGISDIEIEMVRPIVAIKCANTKIIKNKNNAMKTQIIATQPSNI